MLIIQWVGTGLGVLAALSFLVLAAVGLYGAREMTRPRRCDVQDSAGRWGLPEPEHVHFASTDGLRLSAWWFHSPSAAASVVVCHGHGGNKVTNLWVAASLYPHYNVLLLDLRGHGESEGKLTSVGYLERLDIIGAVRWIHAVLGQAPVGLLGISMGAAASLLAAAECPEVTCVVADSPFARLDTPVRTAIRARGYPGVLVPALARSVAFVSGWRLGTVRRWLDPIDVVDRLAPRPLLLIHGQADDMIPVDETHALWERAGEPKKLWIVPEVGHARAAEVDPRGYAETVAGFFEQYLGPRRLERQAEAA